MWRNIGKRPPCQTGSPFCLLLLNESAFLHFPLHRQWMNMFRLRGRDIQAVLMGQLSYAQIKRDEKSRGRRHVAVLQLELCMGFNFRYFSI
jgi:hypothetical protein